MAQEKIVILPQRTFDRLEYAAKIRKLTPEQLASRIILQNALKETCHGCGLEADSFQDKHQPSLEFYPCSSCLRNPAIKDRWNEAWTLDESGKPFIER